MERHRRGRIVVTGFSSAREPIPAITLSNTPRPAVAGLVKSTARQVAASGITVNLVAPGRIDTERLHTIDEYLALDPRRGAGELSGIGRRVSRSLASVF
jgi:3-oxoacyl-[acyl-carrier protein] reductase